MTPDRSDDPLSLRTFRITPLGLTDINYCRINNTHIIIQESDIMRVRFHLPDFSGNFKLNFMFAEMLKQRPEFFREGVEIASFYGVFPPCLWNGGRTQGGMTDKNYIKNVIKAFNDRGIPLRYTFTNMMLEKKHLSDDRCNMILNLSNNGLNEAIVASPILEDYLRRNYPKFKLTSSTCKRLNTEEALLAEL